MSLTNWDGTPYLANKLCSFSMVLVEVVVFIFSISIHLEWASTTIKNMQPRKGPAKSIWIRCQGDNGHYHGSTCAVLGSACISWQPDQVFAVSSISLSIPATRCNFVLGHSSSPLQDVLDGVLQALVDEVLEVL